MRWIKLAAPTDIVAKAQSQIGVKESPANSNNVKYNTEYYGRTINNRDYAWCAVFIWWVFKECKASNLYYGGGKTAYCPTLMNFYKQKGQFSKTPRVGSIVFYDWNSNNSPDHVGIVEKINSDGSITAIEGNTSVGNESNGGCVMRRTRYKSQIIGYAYPYVAGSNSTSFNSNGGNTVTVSLKVLKNGSSGQNVKALQILLNGRGYNCGTPDGVFGSKTLAAVKSFQTRNALEVDGIVGTNTWSSLLK